MTLENLRAQLRFWATFIVLLMNAPNQSEAQALPPLADLPLVNPEYLRDHALTRGFMLGRPVKPRPTPDGTAVLFLRAEARKAQLNLFEFSVLTRQTRLLLTPAKLLAGAEEKISLEEKARRERMRISVGGFTDYQLDRSGDRILVMLSGKLYVYHRSTESVEELKAGEGTLLDPKFSPDGSHVSYVRDYDLYAYDLGRKKEKRLTTGGSELKPRGLAEFVAQEEMGRFSGYWWSPDSKLLAYQENDATGVEVWHVADPAKPDGMPHAAFYPRPGKKNVSVRLGLRPLRENKTVWVQWDAQRYPYLATVVWAEGAPLTIAVQTRDQKELLLLAVDAKTGATRELLAERDNAWINLDQQMPEWLPGAQSFLWTSEREGGPQLELRRANGQLAQVLVLAGAGYLGLAQRDEWRDSLMFRGSTNATEAHLYRMPFSEAGSRAEAPIRLTQKPGLYDAVISRSGDLELRQQMTPDLMPVWTVYEKGELIAELPSVAEKPPFTPKGEILQVGKEGFYAEVIRPQNFQANKRYPVIVDVYGGPHVNVVRAAMNTRLLGQWLADQGFVVVSVDGRGTPGRGRDWERAIYKKFGSVPLEDQVAGLRALGERFKELDLNRVGITGWSFGGYMAAQAALKRPDVFHAAVAGAPVTAWEDYDTHYTERYMGFPDTDAGAYQEGSLLTSAGNLKRPLLLIHGTADDNVYFRHTLRLAEALFRAGQYFELLPLSGLTHMVPDPVVTEQLWSRIARHFKRHLGEPVEQK